MKVLLIDGNPRRDNPPARVFLKAGYELHFARSGRLGIRLAQKTQFNLILLAWSLPDRDGLGILKELRHRNPFPPILMLLKEESLVNTVDALNNGANDCLVMSIGKEILLARARALIRRSNWDSTRQLQQASPSLPHSLPLVSLPDAEAASSPF